MKEKLAFISFASGAGNVFLLFFRFFADICLGGLLEISFGLFFIGLISGIIGLRSQRKKLAKIGIVLSIIGFLFNLILSCAL